MDDIVDSTWNCSLDVDADSTAFSDTSALSSNVITNEFTSKIGKNFEIPQLTLQQQSAFVQPVSEKFNTIIRPTNEANATVIKKPSYLNLACCVNGYSYLTTYDSKLRQNINNSREVSPIRPASNIVQHCKGTGSPCNKNTLKNIYKERKIYEMAASPSKISDECDSTITVANGKYLKENNCKSMNIVTSTDETDQTSKTFIQQRVERLYGIEAISKGFYSPKNSRFQQQEKPVLCERSPNSVKLNTLSNKTKHDDKNVVECLDIQNNGSKDLPVFRHLRPEFRAQLPIIPNKINEDNNTMSVSNLERNTFQTCNMPNNLNGDNKAEFNTIINSSNQDNLNKSINKEINIKNNKFNGEPEINSNFGNILNTSKTVGNTKPELKDITIIAQENIENKSNGVTNGENNINLMASFNGENKSNGVIIDGKYFLDLLKIEQCRLLALASTAETEMEVLSSNSEISEDIFGFLRSASGKARLLVSQKMKQFEGLCLKNLNPVSDDKFLTTISDLEGFWDMVKLQIDHIDSIFEEIKVLKQHGWKRSDDLVCLAPSGTKLTRRPIISSNLKNRKINPIDKIANEPKGANVNKSNNISLAVQKREAQRKQLMDIKRKNKIALATQQQNSENTNDIISNEIAS